MRVSTDASCRTHEMKMRQEAALYIKTRTTQTGTVKNTNRSLIGTFFHQTEELFCGAVVTVLLVQLFNRSQELIDDGLQLCAAYCLKQHKRQMLWSVKNCFL